MKIVLYGATGKAGSRILTELLGRGHEVVAIVRNPDKLAPGERSASTSNRNFEGRQGRGARSHLVSPQMAAAAAIEGHFVDIREWN